MSAALLEHFDLLAGSVGGVAKLRELILSLAVRGRLVPQAPSDEPASELLKRIRAEKDRLIAEGKIKRDKPLAAIGEEEKPYELPEGWEWIRLNALLSKIGAGSTPLGGKEVYTLSGVKFLRSQNVWNEGLRLTDVAFIPSETHMRMSGTVVLPKDILFNITGASIGRCALVSDDFDEANVSQHVTIIRPTLSEVRQFLHLVLISNHVQQTVMDVQVGVSREGLSIGKLGQFLIPLPPLAEQSRIVAKVEELMALCDRLEAGQGHAARVQGHWVEAALDQLAESADAEEFRRHWQHLAAHFDTLFTTPASIDRLDATLLQLAVRGKLVPQDPTDEPVSELLKQIRAEKDRLIAAGKIKRDKPLPPIVDDEKPYELPDSWEWVRFDEIVEPNKPITYGVLVPGPDDPNGIPFVRLGDLSLTVPPSLPEKSISREVDAQYERTRLQGGEILMGVVGSIGKLGIAPSSWRGANIARAVCRIVPTSLVSKEFAILLLKSEFMQTSFIGDTRTVAQPTLNVGLIRSAMTPLPGRAEQSRIVAQVEKLLALTSDLKTRLTAAQTKQAHLRDALIAEVC